MDRTQFLKRYWSYYSKLEQDCIGLSRYIEFRDCNLATCSNEIIGQLLNVGAEFDHFCKIVCSLEPNGRFNIKDYATSLLGGIKDLRQIKVHVQGTSLDLLPFDNWTVETASLLSWWTAYNEVKHNREENYEKGNLQNLLNALAALYFLEMYYVRDLVQKTGNTRALDVPVTASWLFRIVGWRTRFSIIGYNLYVDYEPDFDNVF